jgi:hypothetical protein
MKKVGPSLLCNSGKGPNLNQRHFLNDILVNSKLFKFIH